MLHSIENEQRILDTDLAERLGYERPSVIRELIGRKEVELSRYGVCRSVRQTSGAKGGRPSVAYYLNEEQALLVCMFSDTDNASNVRKQVIDTFMAVRRGQLQPAVPALPNFTDPAEAAIAWATEKFRCFLTVQQQ
ncbi:hypothetical protein [Brucella pituitosa]|uniref:Rha family transcriptional regulator n=1 Tax=Brucella pituitosa TaxID=571256 RepID=A0A643F5N6_9HYPH|nr:hypothetical protein [Brucella pituitosa]KAB0573121.1 hypothetical protein F7Q93_01065 [Brucella pituitosa]